MTDDETPDPLDDLASAHLDGLTSPDDAARIEGDPALAERVAAFGEVRELLRAPVAIDARRREAAARLSPEELTAMAERRQAMWDAMTPEQRAELQRSRPALP